MHSLARAQVTWALLSCHPAGSKPACKDCLVHCINHIPFTRGLSPNLSACDKCIGSGYLVAVFAKMVLPGGSVIGVEKVPELVSTGRGSGALVKK